MCLSIHPICIEQDPSFSTLFLIISEFSLKCFDNLLLQPAINSRFWSNWEIKLWQAFSTSARTLITYPLGIKGLRIFFQIGGSIWHAELMGVLQILHRQCLLPISTIALQVIDSRYHFFHIFKQFDVCRRSLFVMQKDGATRGSPFVSKLTIDKQRVTVSYWCDIKCSLVKCWIYRYLLKTP